MTSNYAQTQPDYTTTVFNYTKANFETINEYITNTNSTLCYSSSDVE